MDLEALDTGRFRFLECVELHLDVEVDVVKSHRILIVFRHTAGMLRLASLAARRKRIASDTVAPGSREQARRVQTSASRLHCSTLLLQYYCTVPGGGLGMNR